MSQAFLIPRQWIGALQDMPLEDLPKLEIWPDGSAIEIEDWDIHISVDGLITAMLPATRAVAAMFASRGGRATSDAKRLEPASAVPPRSLRLSL